MTWSPKRLADIIDFNPKVALEKGKDYPFIAMDRINPTRRYVENCENKVYGGGGAKFADGDILFARITPCLQNGKISQAVLVTGSLGFGSTEFFVFRGKDNQVDQSFLYYLSLTPAMTEPAKNSMVGASGRQRAAISSISELVLTLPQYDEQQRIGELLTQYDDLIETNHRRIALLEESARLLYLEWFVKLRFPGHELVKVVDGLPEGWELKPIADFVTLLSRGITPKYDDLAKGLVINQKCIREGRLNLAPARRQSKEVKQDKLVQLGDILINSTGAGTLGRVAQVRDEIADCTVDTHVTIVRPKSVETMGFLGVALLELAPVFESMGRGATNQLELGRADIGAVQLLTPPNPLQVEFHNIVWPIFEQVNALVNSCNLLAEARDALLPKLMSGQLAV